MQPLHIDLVSRDRLADAMTLAIDQVTAQGQEYRGDMWTRLDAKHG